MGDTLTFSDVEGHAIEVPVVDELGLKNRYNVQSWCDECGQVREYAPTSEAKEELGLTR